MLRHRPHGLRVPLFFRLWFGFVALIVFAIFGAAIFIGYTIIEAGPEGVARTLGEAVKAFEEARR